MKHAIFLHLYYSHLWEEIKERLKRIPFSFNLYANLVEGHTDNNSLVWDIFNSFDKPIINISPNIGMDCGGNLRNLNYWLNHGKGEEILVFLHSKGKPANLQDKAKVKETDELRNLLWSIVTPEKYPLVEKAFEDPSVGMCGVKEWNLNPQTRHGMPIDFCDYYCDILNLNNFKNNSFGFIGGTMFCVRSKIFKNVFSKVNILDIVNELPEYSNGGKIHALERIFGYCCLSEGYQIKGI